MINVCLSPNKLLDAIFAIGCNKLFSLGTYESHNHEIQKLKIEKMFINTIIMYKSVKILVFAKFVYKYCFTFFFNRANGMRIFNLWPLRD